ncbi:Stk1 family PASTA domain-containing Ser/Thr kinase [Anaerovorax odorimutans]|uniref:non-specific serine/threonine protein kinase n=1 Tax=Anaerovorax odorimutans TaxID=109327 RepID=A0ABT1RJC9_9FIRM|nr:Stk1 family PASTA domain-containing Ser/Thr kinase [Anaerovorax odorimutans]MCQ4635297.1 Stk1 family PASTA domain-containing Ser/Thr kinase [Anaerovorax odorimutans]
MSSKILAGRYELFEKIGEGGMSVVYKAKDKLLNRYIAIKVLKPEFVKDRKFIESFRRESQAAASLSHPNIVNIFDVGQEGNIHYIVMELVEGRTLSELIHDEGPLPYPRVIELTKQIAAALSVAHKNQIIHRDVKPHNVLITSGGTAKITDFGIAKAVNSSTIVDTTGGGIMGSVHYFSPEQARGGYVDEKSDIYSLGIVMYEMLTGRVPFDGDNPVNIALMHINSEMVPPSKLVSGIPPALERIVLKCADKYQTNRFASADELIDTLDRLEFVGSVVGNSVFMAGENEKADPDKPLVDTDFDDGDDEDDDDYEEPKKKKKNKKNKNGSGRNKKILIAVIAGLVVVAAVAVAAATGVFSGKPVIVPNLTGQTLEEAQKLAEEVGFEVEQGDLVSDPEIPEGSVVSQSPEANTPAKKGTTIRVNISKGPGNGKVPDVTGKTEDEARELLEANNFKVGNVSTGASELEKGKVYKQSPEAGSTEKEGTAIDLVLSDGSKMKVVVPYLIGKDIDAAQQELEDLGLKPGKVSYESSTTYSVNQVMWQQYDANKEVSKGTSIKLTVSTGPEESKELQLHIDFNQAENEMFFMTVTLSDSDGTRNVIDHQQRIKSDGSEDVMLEGKGKGTVIVTFDGKQVMKKTVDFTKGTIR